MRYRRASLLTALFVARTVLTAPLMAQARGLGRIADPNANNAASLNTSVRIALVIGNAAYNNKPLRNPINDARLIARTLKSLGFTVITRTNLDNKPLKRAIRDFADKLAQANGGDTIGLVYYAGHGVQVAGRNYLLPVDADITHESDVPIEAVAETTILDQLQQAGVAAGIVIIDACRNNPYRAQFRSVARNTRGLARPRAPAGSFLIAYATTPGQLAADGTGANSPYARALADNLKRPGLTIEQTLKLVARQVYHASHRSQRPWMTGSLLEDIYLGGRAVGGATAGAAWQLLATSQDPAEYEAFLVQYGKTSPYYAYKARRKLAVLTQKRQPPSLTITSSPSSRERIALPIQFENDSAKLTDVGAAILSQILTYLKSRGSPNIALIGHVDEYIHLDEAAKKMLSQSRAEVAKKWLMKAGYQGRIIAERLGASTPAAVENRNSYTRSELRTLSQHLELIIE